MDATSAATSTAAKPGYLSGFLGPVPDEIEAFDLKVEGALPPELTGLYLRNGPNPMPGQDPGHNFAGQRMVHGVRLKQGRAAWYRNKWVQTPTMQGARPVRPDGTRDVTAGVANTSVLHYDGRILALVENALPYELSPDLETIGPYDFGGALKSPMTAHPKTDPLTGEIHFFGYDFRPPFLVYHVASRDGVLKHSASLSVTGPTMMHDFAMTRDHVVWLDMPVVFDMQLAMARRSLPYRWSNEYPPRIGVMPRGGSDADVRWFSVKPGYVFHVGNAHEDAQGRIVLDGVYYDRASFDQVWNRLGGTSANGEPKAGKGGVLYRWTLDLATGGVSEAPIDDLAVEFPVVNADRVGLDHRFVYAVSNPLDHNESRANVVKFDVGSGRRTGYTFESGWVPGEAIFVPAAHATSEDDGWLMSIATHVSEDRAQFIVQDASDPTLKPVATIALPRRVPFGFHGAWIAAKA
jgi:carotenoid cleavage dioxygenase